MLRRATFSGSYGRSCAGLPRQSATFPTCPYLQLCKAADDDPGEAALLCLRRTGYSQTFQLHVCAQTEGFGPLDLAGGVKAPKSSRTRRSGTR